MKLYALEFMPSARKAWDKLPRDKKQQLAKRLDERRRNPRIPSAALSGMRDCYKIKLRAEGLRLVYQVREKRLVILVLAIGRRERREAYVEAMQELSKLDERG